MNNSAIALKPVKELLGMNFFIPDYQRGYRWTRQQALDLLHDIEHFTNDTTRSNEEIYCIQPLVVQRKNDSVLEKIQQELSEDKGEAEKLEQISQLMKGSWNVVDGQQRLTTIYLILCALGESKPYSLDYKTRQDTKEFLESIGTATAEQATKHIDHYHIYQVYQTAKEWLCKADINKEQFVECLLENVNFIWYEIAGDNTQDAIAAFKRLNIGKIPLTDAELIKALFLSRANFDCTDADLEAQQRKIAMEWDQIEYAMQDDAFWLFLHSKAYDKPTRIDFILDMIRENNRLGVFGKDKGKEARIAQNEEIRNQIGNDEHKTFRYFYYSFSNCNNRAEWVREKWQCIRQYYQIFNEWYHDYRLFHYIGYLATVDKTKNPVADLVGQWDLHTKDGFVTFVKDKIAERLGRLPGFSRMDTFVYEEPHEYLVDGKMKKDTKSKRDCVEILLLHNIETIIQQNDKLVKNERYALPNFTRFPFHLYKSEHWDVEHIRPNAGDNIPTDMQKPYLALAKNYLPAGSELQALIDAYLTQEKPEITFTDLLEKILVADLSLPDSDKNKIWNYTLLDSTTNKEYGNVIFPIKRAFLANKERGIKIKYTIVGDQLVPTKNTNEIAFVPPCTKNIFTKFYTDVPNGLLEWTEEDAKAYLNDMQEKLEYYLDKARAAK